MLDRPLHRRYLQVTLAQIRYLNCLVSLARPKTDTNQSSETMFANPPNMQSPEELASLFKRNMTLDHVIQPMPLPQPIQVPQDESKIIYASQHYTHSSHIAKQLVGEPIPPRPTSEPTPGGDYGLIGHVLRAHNIDPSTLSTSQLQLFKTADTPQQRRLVELWTISPPTNSNTNTNTSWGNFTTLAQEEAAARNRYAQQQQHDTDDTVMSLDGTPMTPVQTNDGRWVGIETTTSHYMEPYMTSGYEAMARREYEESARRALAEDAAARQQQSFVANKGAVLSTGYRKATDPVYNSTAFISGPAAWEQQAHMENQYGRLVALRMDDEEML